MGRSKLNQTKVAGFKSMGNVLKHRSDSCKKKGNYDNATVKLRVRNSKALRMEQTTCHCKGLLRAEIFRTSQSQTRIRGKYDCEVAK
ncbi:hypothetical protein PanABDRAFT_3976 [Pantoea sp. aB]|nr:hypothetical protein PanABDRAFT_3976 [Pantoea sp. aB]